MNKDYRFELRNAPRLVLILVFWMAYITVVSGLAVLLVESAVRVARWATPTHFIAILVIFGVVLALAGRLVRRTG